MLQYLTTQSNIDLPNKAAGSGVDKKKQIYSIHQPADPPIHSSDALC